MKKTWLTSVLAAFAACVLCGCAAPAGSHPDDVRLNPVHQVGATGDVWECKTGACQKIR
ncbi:MAG: hypothetical protein Q4D61_07385 [Cardiobacteriaceae bacterium]|nr:hypothetical protein [Cardiobacteriaceae bacterium]